MPYTARLNNDRYGRPPRNEQPRYTSGKNTLEQIDNGGSPATVYSTFAYDDAGNQLSANTDRHFQWDAADQLRYFKREASGSITSEAHYLYAGGQRIKKFVRNASGGLTITVYIDGVYEHRYTKSSAGTITAQQTLVHVMDGRSRIATMRQGSVMDDIGTATKYNLEDHLGTSTTRLTGSGSVIDREEYYPFGDSSLRTFSSKRYRYVGKELDSESGLYYYGARYYAAWIGRFISVDPLADKYPQLTPYNYAANDPIGDLDIDGMQNTKTEEGGASSSGSSNSMSPANQELRRPIVLGTVQEIARPAASAAPKPNKPEATNTLSPADVSRIYATIHGFASPINTDTPTAVLRQAEKPLATSIKEGLKHVSLMGKEGQMLEFVGMMAYGAVEDASIFFQSWGVGTPRDLEGMPVGATQRQDAFFNTATEAMGPLMKGFTSMRFLNRGSAPLTIASSSSGDVGALGGRLTSRQTGLLNQLQGFGSSTTVRKSDVSLADLSALTRSTGDEFGMFTLGGRRQVYRGNSVNLGLT